MDRHVRARLYHWMHIVKECSSILLLAKRASAHADTAEVRSADTAYVADQRKYIEAHPKYKQGKGVPHSLFLEYGARNPRPFGHPVELALTSDYCRLLAMTLFCQINTGEGDHALIAKNSSKIMREQYDQIVARAFPKVKEQEKYVALADLVKSARDNLIAHGAGPALSVKHTPSVISIGLVSNALKGIDFEYFFEILALLHESIRAQAMPKT